METISWDDIWRNSWHVSYLVHDGVANTEILPLVCVDDIENVALINQAQARRSEDFKFPWLHWFKLWQSFTFLSSSELFSLKAVDDQLWISGALRDWTNSLRSINLQTQCNFIHVAEFNPLGLMKHTTHYKSVIIMMNRRANGPPHLCPWRQWPIWLQWEVQSLTAPPNPLVNQHGDIFWGYSDKAHFQTRPNTVNGGGTNRPPFSMHAMDCDCEVNHQQLALSGNYQHLSTPLRT